MANRAMKISALWLPWLFLAFITASVNAATTTTKKTPPRLTVFHGSRVRSRNNPGSTQASSSFPRDYKTFFYNQTLDHFNYLPESYATFRQRYVVNFKHWRGAQVAAPIFVYFGEEGSIDNDVDQIGFLVENAARFGALQVYIEHRYYGQSIPFGSRAEAMKNASTLGYFNSAQALADYAEVIINLKKNLSAHSSPVIVVGASYSAMLASWFRLKYPHVALGALASSAPILYFDDITPQDGYYSIVAKDFKEASKNCHDTIRHSWSALDKAAAKPNGLAVLSKKFKTCQRMTDVSELKEFLDGIYTGAAQYDMPPRYPVNVICKAIDGASRKTDILDRIFAGVVAYKKNKTCYDLHEYDFSDETEQGWSWQTCSDMVIPIGITSNNTMFPAEPFDLQESIDYCKNLYGVPPRPHWITSYYGGQDIKLVLKKFGSNIIFSNGLRDPYSSGGSLQSTYINKWLNCAGSHCLDILLAKKDDPKWLVMQRKKEVEIVNGWLLKYYEDISALWLPWLFLAFITASVNATTTTTKKTPPRLTVFHGSRVRSRNNPGSTQASSSFPRDYKTFFYNQTLDHFNYLPESYATFRQRYVVNFKHWRGAQVAAPIFVYFGEEGSLDDDVDQIGFLVENAARFGALQVYIEHRYYGQSIPFGSRAEAMKNASTLGYFNSAQALADYAEVIINLKKNLSAHSSPVIVVGASYSAMLASWFRLKYPHVALGALASSAPILYFDDITPQDGYYSIVAKDFKEASKNCHDTIRHSWSALDKAAAKPNGLAVLSKKFKTCQRMTDVSELKEFLDSIYTEAAQYDMPPRYPVNVICKAIDGASGKTDILDRIFAGVVAYKKNKTCYDLHEDDDSSDETNQGWSWQTCSEMAIPIGITSNNTMFPAEPFDLEEFIDYCKNLYGVPPRPHWITSYYGGQDIKLVLKKFGNNIIFSNGLRDPYSSGGVLEDISQSIVAVKTVQGSHCLDILLARKDDPKWLVMQRKKEVEIVNGWLLKYYEDVRAS
ncbi:hypothetical protein L1049_011217 [Liquidambar formosana]|uniref:Lysosomal Pro-X carboxypeptidase n=1 Tax=Liquidambar formosana TaxID=63359 RepID=A0AAP0RRC7_LIQFO